MNWTAGIIRARFIEAADTERRMPKGGGGSNSGFWPQYLHSFEDMAGWGTKRLAEEREMRMRRIPPSAAAISRHSEVMEWTARLIQDERRRRIAWAWAWCQLTGSSFAARCKREGWVKMTAYRRLSGVFTSIASHLDNEGVLLRLPDEKWVLPEAPNSGTALHTLAVDDDEAPPLSPTSQIFDGDRPGHTLTSPQAVAEFEKHLERVNKRRRKEQERRKKLGMDESAA